MANTYSQINIHSVFAVKGRENTITKSYRDDLHKYMSGILREDGSFPLAVGGWKDHVHVFFEMKVTMAVSKQMQMLKATSSKWNNDNQLIKGKFQWQACLPKGSSARRQEGYGAFSYSKSDLPNVIQYIKNQEEHHKKRSFIEEYEDLLKEFEIDYDERFVFKPVDYIVPDGTS